LIVTSTRVPSMVKVWSTLSLFTIVMAEAEAALKQLGWNPKSWIVIVNGLLAERSTAFPSVQALLLLALPPPYGDPAVLPLLLHAAAVRARLAINTSPILRMSPPSAQRFNPVAPSTFNVGSVVDLPVPVGLASAVPSDVGRGVFRGRSTTIEPRV
jgi:hypothetical protein